MSDSIVVKQAEYDRLKLLVGVLEIELYNGKKCLVVNGKEIIVVGK